MTKLKYFLKQNDIRQVELAKRLGICPTFLNRVLNGSKKIPEKYYPKLASELKMTASELERILPL